MADDTVVGPPPRLERHQSGHPHHTRTEQVKLRGVQHTLWLAGSIDAGLIAIGIASTYDYGIGAHGHVSLGLGVLAGAIAATAIVNFMSFYWFFRLVMDAIAATVTLTYFIFLACMLNTHVQDALHHSTLGDSMLTSLTTLTATVVGFYFAGASYERVAAARAGVPPQSDATADRQQQ